MLKRKLLAKQIVFAMGVNFILFAVGPIRVAILTRNLEVRDYGIFSLIMVTLTFLTYFFTLGLGQFIIRTLPAKNEREQITVFKSLLVFVLLLAGAFLFISTLVMSQIEYFRPYLTVLYLIMLIILGTLYFTLLAVYFYAGQKLYFYNLLLLFKNLLWMIILIPYVFFYKITLTKVLLFWLFGIIVTIFIGSIRIKFHWFTLETLNRKIIYQGLRYSIPLLPALLGPLAIPIFNRYILTYYSGAQQVAFFSVAFGLVNLPFLAIVCVPDMIFPHVISFWNQGQADFSLKDAAESYKEALRNFTIKYSLILLLPGISVIVLMRKEIVLLLAGSNYGVSATIIPWLIIVPLLMMANKIFEQELMIRDKTKNISLAYILGIAVNIILNFLFIPKKGIYGAALAVSISHFVVFVALCRMAKGYIRIDNKQITLGKILAGNVIFIAIILGLKSCTNMISVIMLSVVVYGLILFGTVSSDFRPKRSSKPAKIC